MSLIPLPPPRLAPPPSPWLRRHQVGGTSGHAGHEGRKGPKRNRVEAMSAQRGEEEKHEKHRGNNKAAGPPVMSATLMLQHSSVQAMGWKRSDRGPPFLRGFQQRNSSSWSPWSGVNRCRGGRIGAQDLLTTEDVQGEVRKQLRDAPRLLLLRRPADTGCGDRAKHPWVLPAGRGTVSVVTSAGQEPRVCSRPALQLPEELLERPSR